MLEHLDDEAHQAIREAEAVAHRLAHHYIGTEHMLVGLSRCDGSLAQRALQYWKLDADRLEAHVDELLGRGQVPLGVRPPFTSSAALVLERSRWEARQRGSRSIGVEHLILGLLRLPQSTAATLLSGLGVNLAQIEAAVLDPPPDGATPPELTAEPTAPAPGPVAVAVAVVPDRRDDRAEDPLAIQVMRLSREVRELQAEVRRLRVLVEPSAEPDADPTA